MLEQRSANLTLNSVFDILNGIPFFTVFSYKCNPFHCIQSNDGVLASQLFTDAQTKDSKTYPKTVCLKLFITSFHFVLLKDQSFHLCLVKNKPFPL